MRCVRFLFFVLGLGLPLLAMAARPPYDIGNQTPADFATVRRQVTQEIPAYLAASQCGGWDRNQSVAGKIATVTGVPGRSGVWDGALLSGMAVRNDDYAFPEIDTTTGFVTACDAGTSSIEKLVWDPAARKRVPRTFGHPYFLDPICRWRVMPGVAVVNPPPYDPPTFAEIRDGADNIVPLSPPTCEGMCAYLNVWQYEDCLEMEPLRDDDGDLVIDEDGDVLYRCLDLDMRYICTDVPVRDGGSCAPGDLNGGPNARACVGAACRCPGPGCTRSPAGAAEGSSPAGRWYLSYFRRYLGAYSRAPVLPQVPTDKAVEPAIPVACYGLYEEFDPKERRTASRDRRCVIDLDVADRHRTQAGKGTYGERSNLPDPAPVQRNPSYDADEDLWYENLGAGFSLLNERVFDDEYDRNLSVVLQDESRLDQARQTSLPQLDAARPIAAGSLVRAFDDTAAERTIATWWQKQQQEVSVLLHRPVIRMLLPTGWALGADPFDPLFFARSVPSSDPLERRGERIEVQIDADEDMLGVALRALERSLLLRVEEEPVPVVVPLGSPVEFRAMAEMWCLWWMRRQNAPTCDDAPYEVTQLRETLLSYAERIEDVRMVRGELARYAGALLHLQQETIRPLSDWVSEHIDGYRAILTEQRALVDSVRARWRPIQTTMDRFHAQSNRPWCMNQRFTLPVYSLLDEWMFTRASGGSVRNDEGYPLPTLSIPRPEDIVIDLSVLSLATGSVILPVLKPVQIRIIDLPQPPSVVSAHGIERALPQLPPIDPVLDAIRQAVTSLPEPPPPGAAPVLPPPAFPAPLGDHFTSMLLPTLDWIAYTVMAMEYRYRQFWESIGPLRTADRDAQAGNESSHLRRKQRLECTGWDDAHCQHVEMDLIERLTRIASRPDVQLREDYLSVGSERVFVTCPPENHVCPPLHPETSVPPVRWEIIGPREQQDAAEAMRSAIRDATLPEPLGTIPRDDLPHYGIDLQELPPVYDVPRPIDLSPPSDSDS